MLYVNLTPTSRKDFGAVACSSIESVFFFHSFRGEQIFLYFIVLRSLLLGEEEKIESCIDKIPSSAMADVIAEQKHRAKSNAAKSNTGKTFY
jgi:hypothetical protein